MNSWRSSHKADKSSQVDNIDKAELLRIATAPGVIEMITGDIQPIEWWQGFETDE